MTSYRDRLVDIDPALLRVNPWNPNQVDPINQEKLARSLAREGLQKAILVRTLDDGVRQILDGQHRVKAAIELGWPTVPCVDLGRITDGEAKKQTLIGNQKYGQDDPLMMANLLSDSEIGSAQDLIDTLPIDEETLTSFFSHLDIDLDDLDDLDDIDASDDLDLDVASSKPTKTHQILRFKIGVEDAVHVTELITRIKHEQGFTESDDLTNAGDALVYLARKTEEVAEEE